ncbi:MAG: DUF3078 domain-containing protein [Bacteroidales bacterium]|jgi:hypothetical protein|nr:DUF3078 domain-containing protein [Bacteroidales bacterium]
MKKIFSVLFLFISFYGFSQSEPAASNASAASASSALAAAPADTATLKPKYWVFKGMAGFNVAQTSLTNWSAGGENSVSGNVVGNLNILYSKEGHNWESNLQSEYGLMWTPSKKFNKTVDKLFVASKYGYRMAQNEKANIWLYTVSVDFQTQYDKGYKNVGDENYISTWMAPAYFNASLGIDYHYKSIFSAYLSPLTSRTTFVLDTFLSNQGAFGVSAGQSVLAQMGISAKAQVNYTLCKNVTLQSSLSLFTPYPINKDIDKFGNFVVDWDVLFLLKVNSFLSATINTNLKYDDKVKTTDADGNISGAKVQFKEMITVGIVYAFDSTKPHKKKWRK